MRMIKTTQGERIFDEFDSRCHDCLEKRIELVENCPITGRKSRLSFVAAKDGEIIDCTTNPNLVISKRAHIKTLSQSEKVITTLYRYKKTIEEQYQRDYRRLLHNLVSHDAHIIQEFQNIVPEAKLIKSGRQQIQSISDAIAANSQDAAQALLKIFQNAIAIKNEIATHQRLYVNSDKLELRRHRIHKVLMHTIYKFFTDFANKKIFVNIQETNDELLIDYEYISIVLYHIFDNAIKYALQGKNIAISVERQNNRYRLIIEMISLRIMPCEKEKIFQYGFSGEQAVKIGKNGSGYGMSIVGEILKKHELTLLIQNGAHTEVPVLFNGSEYEKNKFIIEFPKRFMC